MADHRHVDISSMTRRRFLRAGVAALGASAAWPAFAQGVPVRKLDVPYEPSPQDVVEKMLEMAKVSSNDLLYDLGCGDGRIVVTAARKYGARGVGIDLDPQRIEEAKNNARVADVEDRVRFVVGDLYASDFSDATVVTLFLWPHINRKLRPILWRQLKVGTRVASHVWDMGVDWPPERTEIVRDRKIHLWTVTEAQKRLAGR